MPSSEQSNVVNHSETEITNDSNIIPYSQYVIESQQAVVQNSNSSVQQDALILSVIEQLKTQVVNYTKINLDNKSVNDTLTDELERYKEQVKVLKEGQNVDLRSNDNVSDSSAQSVEIDRLKRTLSEHLKEKESLMQTVTLLKNDFKKEESRNIDKEIALEKKIKQLDNIVFKRDQSAQTIHMLTKPQFFYDHTTKQALARHGLVLGLPKLNFENDHMCCACAMGKSNKKPHKPKSEDTNQEKLYLLHMDLCGPMRVASVNGKKYILFIVDDYSRFTWVKCLRSKDEALDFIIKFLKMIQVRLKVPIRRIRTANGTEFVNQTLRVYYEKVGISYETYVARSLQQNGIVERRNRTLIEAAHTMLIYAKALLFLWAKAVATTYFDELTAMAFEHSSSGPALHEMTPATISSGLVPNPPPSTPFVPPSRSDWDLLFQQLFEELLTPPPSVDHPAPEVIAPIDEVVSPVLAVSIGSPSSTTVDQDAPAPSNSQTTSETQSPILPNDVEEDNHDLDVAHINNNPFFGIPILENDSEASSSSDVIPTVVQSAAPFSEHVTKWTKDHPFDNIIGELERPVSTRLQLHEQALFCYYDAFLTSVEPKNYKDALTQACWIEAMQEELHEFDRLEV
ncbi:retrovirus-related pol polyprotein from transposon TNT 1-94 [Tanacetum coccineum]